MTTVELLLAQRKSFFEGTEMIIAGIKPEMFDLKPFPEAMSIGEQIDHIAYVEADLLSETAEALKLEKIQFDFKKSDDLPTAIEQWHRIHALGDEFISKLDDEKLNTMFLTVSHTPMFIHQMINTVLEHEVHHRGEIISYFRMIKDEPPKRWKD
jgi:uncharacterized damage-inducible protein DinB